MSPESYHRKLALDQSRHGEFNSGASAKNCTSLSCGFRYSSVSFGIDVANERSLMLINSLYRNFAKRLLDITIAAVAGVCLSPVLAVTAFLVVCKLGRPVLFRQQRPGKDGQPFHLLKFRTMTDGRDANGNLLPDSQRLTNFGKRLRETSLDELPALWNILLGHMSIVGPRPLLMQYLPRYTPRQACRHDVRPGLTGLAQVSGRNLLAWEDRFELDVQYVQNLTLWQDITIVARTFGAVFARRGISHEGSVTMPEFMGSPALQPEERGVYVIGAGGHAKVVIALLQSLSYEVNAIFDDDAETHGNVIRGATVIGSVGSIADHPRRPTVIAIGNNLLREDIAGKFDLPWLTAIHPNASVDSSVRIGEGTVIMDGAIIQPDTVIGNHVIVNTAASIDHDGNIEDFAHIAPGCHLAGGVHVGANSLIGIGTSIIPLMHIGKRCIVGAGSVVVNAIDDDQVAMGVPARSQSATIKRVA
jgi:sugar O-acyltransferase (sialic acid O-acetyltransferase NeuD family)